jgi:hypothetical protein
MLKRHKRRAQKVAVLHASLQIALEQAAALAAANNGSTTGTQPTPGTANCGQQ